MAVAKRGGARLVTRWLWRLASPVAGPGGWRSTGAAGWSDVPTREAGLTVWRWWVVDWYVGDAVHEEKLGFVEIGHIAGTAHTFGATGFECGYPFGELGALGV